MLNYDRVLFHTIGRRVRNLRENVDRDGISQAQLVHRMQTVSDKGDGEHVWVIDQRTIAKVEQGLAGRKNPYLLSANQIGCLAKVFGITPKELVWGDETEREDLVRLMLIAIIADRAKTDPFVYYDNTELPEFFAWAKKQKCLDDDLREIALFADQMVQELPKAGMVTQGMRLRDGTTVTVGEAYERLSAFFSERYGWFYSADNKRLYDLLHSDAVDSDNDRAKRQHNLADVVLESIMADLRFAMAFCNRVSNSANNTGYTSDEITEAATKDLRGDKGRFADIAMDYGEYDYYLFVDAFRRFWERHGEALVRVMDESIFTEAKLANGLKVAVKGVDGYEQRLIKAIKDGDSDKDYEVDRVLGENYFEQTIQYIKAYRLVHAQGDNNWYDDYFGYTSASHALTSDCIAKRIDGIK